MKLYAILIIVFFINLEYVHSQSCETFNRKLFHGLTKECPDTINCTDSNGLKQGWWIHYQLKHKTSDIPAILSKGLDVKKSSEVEYVDGYSIGIYKDNHKNGTWMSMANRLDDNFLRSDIYYYAKDTNIVKSYIGSFPDILTLYFNSDSSIVKSMTQKFFDNDVVCISCNKNDSSENQCIMTYKNNIISKFPFKFFELELEKTFYFGKAFYIREKKQIDELPQTNKNKGCM